MMSCISDVCLQTATTYRQSLFSRDIDSVGGDVVKDSVNWQLIDDVILHIGIQRHRSLSLLGKRGERTLIKKRGLFRAVFVKF